MAEPLRVPDSASHLPTVDGGSSSPDSQSPDSPSLDPAAIERAYLRERARRNRRIAHREYTRNSQARFWMMLALLMLVAVVIGLAAFHEIQTNFGVLQ